MKKDWLLTVTVIVGIVSFFSVLGYGLALTDISHDYISPSIWGQLGQSQPGGLPEWTACSGEWMAVSFGYWPILLFHILLLVYLIRNSKQKAQQASQSTDD